MLANKLLIKTKYKLAPPRLKMGKKKEENFHQQENDENIEGDENQQEDEDYQQEDIDVQGQQEQMNVPQDQEGDDSDQQHGIEPPRRKRVKKNPQQQQNGKCVMDSDDSSNLQDIFDDQNVLDKLPLERGKLQDLLIEVGSRIRHYRNIFFNEQALLPTKKSHVGERAIPICGDVTKLDFDKLISKQLQIANRQFDVLMMDPPWRLSTSQPSRGVAIQYQSLSDQLIQKIPVEKLQKQGFLFVWVINAKFQWTVNTMEKKWGYKVIDSINWVKKTVNGKIAKGHGFYLQHAKQTCLVGYKGDFSKFNGNVTCDIIFSDRRGQSQKPTQIYEYIEELVPNGYYLQIFGRRNNLRDRWVTIGNEL